MENFPNEVLTEIFSYLDQKDVFLSVALVCKSFCQATKNPRRVRIHQATKFTKGQNDSLMELLRVNTLQENLVLHSGAGCDIMKILQILPNKTKSLFLIY
jgi:hypothetical protein